jgi:peptide/nickel transport system ATP-binding protein
MPSLLEIDDLKVQFPLRDGIVRAADGVSLAVDRGEVLGLVGESGSGKSVTGFAILGLVDPPGRIVAGSVRFRGEQLIGRPEAELRRLRGRDIAMVFQDPMMTLNPVLRIDTQMIEAITAHERVSARAARARARAALAAVGIAWPDERLLAYPHQLSGGMRQRVAIAIALLHRPALVIADEPTTALDVTTQSQIVAQMQALCAEAGTALIWITHDLALISGFADRVAVMYAGRIVEQGPAAAVLAAPLHPYTRGLIGSLMGGGAPGAPLAQIPGLPPSPMNLPPGCAFAPRCPRADAACATAPENAAYPGGRAARCWHPHAALETVA